MATGAKDVAQSQASAKHREKLVIKDDGTHFEAHIILIS